MKLADAATQFIDTDRQIKALTVQRDIAADALKVYFRRSGKTVYRGIVYGVSMVSRLDTRKARELLGPTKTAEATVQSRRETLTAPRDPALTPAEDAAVSAA